MEEYLERFWKFLLYLLPYALIYSVKLSNGLIIALAVLALAIYVISRRNPIPVGRFLFASTLFFVTAICLSYSDQKSTGLALLETRLPLIIFPLIFSLRMPDQQVRARFMSHLIIALTVTFFALEFIGLYRNSLAPDPETWFVKWYYHYSDLTLPIGIDPLYLSLFVCFAVLVLVADLIGLTNLGIIPRKSVRYFCLTVLVVFIAILSVRSTLIILIAMLVMFILLSYARLGKRTSITIALVIVGVIVLSFISPVTSNRFKGLMTRQFDFSGYTLDRFIIWTTAIEHVKSNPSSFVIGGGTGSSATLMDGLYETKGISWGFEQKNNTHNQYLEFLLNTGFIGLAIFVLFLVNCAFQFHRSGNRIGFLFVVMFSLAMVSENYLDRQKGVAFFSLLLALLFFGDDKEKAETRPDLGS